MPTWIFEPRLQCLRSVFCALAVFLALSPRILLGLEIERRYQIDFIDGLHLFNTTYDGVHMAVGIHSYSPAILLQGDSRSVRLSDDVYDRATRLLSSTNEFTVLATVQQEEKNAGSIIAFSEGNNRFLELQSSARKDEIRLHYTHKDSVYVEIFPYRLADGKWHRLAVTVSGNHVTLLVDCNRIYERVIRDVDRKFQGRNLSLWLGQRNSRHFLFKGGLQDVKIVGQEHGYLMQCPHLDTECPTCGQFRQLQMSVVHLENYIKELTNRLAQAENRITQVEECECQKSCRGNGSLHLDGATWQQGCDICSCSKGVIRCHDIKCPDATCKNPVYISGECCPACLQQCLLKGVLYDHGEQINPRECINCTCHDGNMKCDKINPDLQCPKLTCPEDKQFSVPGECCKFCPGVDYCIQGHNCHVNATCVNLHTRSTCQCNVGFEGDGKSCQDIDECAVEGGHHGHHCHRNTKCVNIMGSYVCECTPGYSRLDTFNCAEHDECRSGDHQCHEEAVCINTAGSYHCQCKEGFQGNGFECEPVCNQTCLNGGKCVAPGECSCRRGYVGPSCEIDVDECSLGIHQCNPNSICMNLPGWYYCDCKPGYFSFLQDNNLGILCQDIDECEDGSHTCHGTAKCVNTLGAFECQCHNYSTCSLNCIYEGIERRNGSIWAPQNTSCTQCKCQSGIATCSRDQCDCSDSNVNLDCCPHCDRSTQCQHQERPIYFQNGQRWIYQCQLCECLYGEIDCWPIECPPPTCDNPSRSSGDCCPRCEDDPCALDAKQSTPSSNSTSQASRGCTYNGRAYHNGDRLDTTPSDRCTTCKCKNGHLCCSFSANCAHNLTTVAPNLVPGGHSKVRTGIYGVLVLAADPNAQDVNEATTSQMVTTPTDNERSRGSARNPSPTDVSSGPGSAAVNSRTPTSASVEPATVTATTSDRPVGKDVTRTTAPPSCSESVTSGITTNGLTSPPQRSSTTTRDGEPTITSTLKTPYKIRMSSGKRADVATTISVEADPIERTSPPSTIRDGGEFSKSFRPSVGTTVHATSTGQSSTTPSSGGIGNTATTSSDVTRAGLIPTTSRRRAMMTLPSLYISTYVRGTATAAMASGMRRSDSAGATTPMVVPSRRSSLSSVTTARSISRSLSRSIPVDVDSQSTDSTSLAPPKTNSRHDG